MHLDRAPAAAANGTVRDQEAISRNDVVYSDHFARFVGVYTMPGTVFTLFEDIRIEAPYWNEKRRGSICIKRGLSRINER